MSSWYSNILTTTTSRLNNLQRQVFASENDGDTEDDTHVCRVLRQYYHENGRNLPAWLPPDPKAPPPTPIIQQPQHPGVGARYGSASAQGGGGAGPGGNPGLSSLWDNNRGRGGSAGAGAGATTPVTASSRNPFARNAVTPDPGMGGAAAAAARPLTSQRTGSGSDAASTGGGAGGGGGVSSAQDRLRQRLWGSGARTVSPGSTSGPFVPPPQQQQAQNSGRGASARGSGGGDYDPYGPGGQYDGGGGTGARQGIPRRGVGSLPSGPRMR